MGCVPFLAIYSHRVKKIDLLVSVGRFKLLASWIVPFYTSYSHPKGRSAHCKAHAIRRLTELQERDRLTETILYKRVVGLVLVRSSHSRSSLLREDGGSGSYDAQKFFGGDEAILDL